MKKCCAWERLSHGKLTIFLLLTFCQLLELLIAFLNFTRNPLSTIYHLDRWRMKDSVPMKGLWRKGFINFGVELTRPIIQIKFVHRLEAHMNGCPDQCNPVSIADIRLDCERPDSFKLTTPQCQEKEKPSAGCFVNAFRPYHKGNVKLFNSYT